MNLTWQKTEVTAESFIISSTRFIRDCRWFKSNIMTLFKFPLGHFAQFRWKIHWMYYVQLQLGEFACVCVAKTHTRKAEMKHSNLNEISLCASSCAWHIIHIHRQWHAAHVHTLVLSKQSNKRSRAHKHMRSLRIFILGTVYTLYTIHYTCTSSFVVCDVEFHGTTTATTTLLLLAAADMRYAAASFQSCCCTFIEHTHRELACVLGRSLCVCVCVAWVNVMRTCGTWAFIRWRIRSNRPTRRLRACEHVDDKYYMCIQSFSRSAYDSVSVSVRLSPLRIEPTLCK